jgi:hypothetical protein
VKLFAPAAGAPGLFPSVVLIAGLDASVVVAAKAGTVRRATTAAAVIVKRMLVLLFPPTAKATIICEGGTCRRCHSFSRRNHR